MFKNRTSGRARLGLTTGLIAVGLFACGGEQPPLQTDLPEPLTSVATDSLQVGFYQLDDDELLVVGKGDFPQNLRGASPVHVYEQLANEPAPQALKDLELAINALKANEPPTEFEVDEAIEIAPPDEMTLDVDNDDLAVPQPSDNPTIGRVTSSLSSSQFQSMHCNPSGVDFEFCYTRRTNNWTSWQRNGVDWIHSHANAYRGTITHTVRRRNGALGSWSTVFADTLNQAAYVSTYTSGNNARYQVRITQASGDGWHIAIHGDD